MTAAVERACEILERSNRPITPEEAQSKIDNAKAVYDCLHSDFIQRKTALFTIEVYTAVKEMLERAG